MRYASLSLGLLAATATATQAIRPNPIGDLMKRQDQDDFEKERESRKAEQSACLTAMNNALGTDRPPVPTAVLEYVDSRPPYTPTEEEYENGGPLCTQTFPASLSSDVTAYFSSYITWYSSRSSELSGVITFVCANQTETVKLGPLEEDNNGCTAGGFLFTGAGITTFDPLEYAVSTTPPSASATPSSEAQTSELPSSEASETGSSPSQVDDDSGAPRATGVFAAGMLAAAGAVAFAL
ncbi:hypothetical protein ACHAQA_010134 [Verticillium albo-atrum]